MKADFMNDFADFLEERLGKALFTLRERNENYRNLSNEYETLLNTQSQDIEVYRQAITKLSGIEKKLAVIEKHYLFLAGMREHTRLEDVMLSETFEKMFLDVE